MNSEKLRPMTDSDLEQVLHWRNHPDVRRFMYTTHQITLKEHRAWFASANRNPGMHLLIYENDGAPCGFVHFTTGRTREVADWGFYLSPSSPKGVGKSLGRLALEHAFNGLRFHKVCGQALGFNERSIAFHLALGFVEEGRLREQHFDGAIFHDVLCFGVLAFEWQSQSKERIDD